MRRYHLGKNKGDPSINQFRDDMVSRIDIESYSKSLILILVELSLLIISSTKAYFTYNNFPLFITKLINDHDYIVTKIVISLLSTIGVYYSKLYMLLNLTSSYLLSTILFQLNMMDRIIYSMCISNVNIYIYYVDKNSEKFTVTVPKRSHSVPCEHHKHHENDYIFISYPRYGKVTNNYMEMSKRLNISSEQHATKFLNKMLDENVE